MDQNNEPNLKGKPVDWVTQNSVSYPGQFNRNDEISLVDVVRAFRGKLKTFIVFFVLCLPFVLWGAYQVSTDYRYTQEITIPSAFKKSIKSPTLLAHQFLSTFQSKTKKNSLKRNVEIDPVVFKSHFSLKPQGLSWPVVVLRVNAGLKDKAQVETIFADAVNVLRTLAKPDADLYLNSVNFRIGALKKMITRFSPSKKVNQDLRSFKSRENALADTVRDSSNESLLLKANEDLISQKLALVNFKGETKAFSPIVIKRQQSLPVIFCVALLLMLLIPALLTSLTVALSAFQRILRSTDE